MQIKNNILVSGRGSIRYIDGVFYDSNYHEVFVPLTNLEYHAFSTRVEVLEKSMGRKLAISEIRSVASELENGEIAA